jgi:hypothetical protein
VERLAHCAAIRESQEDESAWIQFGFLYDNLSILDSKAASLLQFNAVILAVDAILFASSSSHILRYYLLADLMLSIFSCIACLVVVWVHWSTTADLRNIAEHGLVLLRVRDRRTVLYRVAWWLAVMALAGLVLGTVLSMVVGSV